MQAECLQPLPGRPPLCAAQAAAALRPAGCAASQANRHSDTTYTLALHGDSARLPKTTQCTQQPTTSWPLKQCAPLTYGTTCGTTTFTPLSQQLRWQSMINPPCAATGTGKSGPQTSPATRQQSSTQPSRATPTLHHWRFICPCMTQACTPVCHRSSGILMKQQPAHAYRRYKFQPPCPCTESKNCRHIHVTLHYGVALAQGRLLT